MQTEIKSKKLWSADIWNRLKYNVSFLSIFGLQVNIINERKRTSRIWANVYLSIKNLKLPGPWSNPLTQLQIACFAYPTSYHYFQPSKLALTPDKILEPHLHTMPTCVQITQAFRN